MHRSMLRERVAGSHARVTFVELFFDLVFVFAVTRISHGLLAYLTWLGALQAGLMVMTVWWAWIYTAWITNWLDPENSKVRLMLFALMGVGLILSTSLSEAFGERGPVFACAYVAFQLGRTLFMLWAGWREPALRRNFQRVAIWLVLSGAIWILGALVQGGERLALWALAIGLEYLSVALAFWVPGLGRTPTEDWTVEGGHMAERCGLFIIICLGESVLVTGAAFTELAWTPVTLAAFAAAFIGTLAMWWIYFSAHAEAASEAISASDDPGRIARMAYTYIHILLVAGVILTAAGDELALAHPSAPMDNATALVLLGGPGLFLIGALLFKHYVFEVWSASRLTGLALLLALAPLAPNLTPLGLSGAATAIFCLVGAWESWMRRAGTDLTPTKKGAASLLRP
jgi:low temperature requirement protein LtrA